MTTDNTLSIDEATRLARTDRRIIQRAIDNGLAIPSASSGIQFAKPEVEAWLDPGRVHELLASRLRRASNGMFFGNFPEPDTYRHKNRFILPFVGSWLVQDGGDMKTADGRIRNTHCQCEPCYRWACDFVVIAPDDIPKAYVGMSLGEMHRLRRRRGQPEGIPDVESSEPGDALEECFWNIINEDILDPRLSYLYEVDVIAPASGVFMTRKGKVYDPQFEEIVGKLASQGKDDEMGFMIDHGSSEISQIGHVLGRTIQIKPGEKVHQGQTLCKAGGRHRYLPHLHWAIRDSYSDYLASGLPIMISNCSVYEKPSSGGSNKNAKLLKEHGGFVPKTNILLQRGMVVKNNWPNPT